LNFRLSLEKIVHETLPGTLRETFWGRRDRIEEAMMDSQQNAEEPERNFFDRRKDIWKK